MTRFQPLRSIQRLPRTSAESTMHYNALSRVIGRGVRVKLDIAQGRVASR